MTGGFASKRTSNAVSIWWRHHVLFVWRYLLWEQYFHLCYTVFTIAFYKTMLQRDLTVLYGINKNNFHISDTRFRHLFLNYYQKRDSVMAMTWRVLDEVTVVPWMKTRSRIECACSCANWSNCTRIWFISVEKTCYHVTLEVVWPWMTRDWYCFHLLMFVYKCSKHLNRFPRDARFNCALICFSSVERICYHWLRLSIWIKFNRCKNMERHHYKEWGEILYPFRNFNVCTVEVW